MKKTAIIILFIIGIAYAVSPTHMAFNNGQLSPLLEARPDYNKYDSSCRTIENMFVTSIGSAIRRPGTAYVADSNGVARLIPFEYSTDDSYVLEFADTGLRFFRDDE